MKRRLINFFQTRKGALIMGIMLTIIFTILLIQGYKSRGYVEPPMFDCITSGAFFGVLSTAVIQMILLGCTKNNNDS